MKQNKQNKQNKQDKQEEKALMQKNLELQEKSKAKVSNKENPYNEKKKLKGKDIAIIVLSICSLILLIAVIFMSMRREKMITAYLENGSETASDDGATSMKNGYDNYLYISEVSADKWIELHNIGVENVDLTGVKIIIRGKEAVTFPEETIISKEGYLTIDVNDSLKNGGLVSLVDVDGKTFRTMSIPAIPSGKSYGQANSELNTWGFMEPTRDADNDSTDVEFVEYGGIGFSAPGGYYDDVFELELTCGDGETIYYTTDGTAPTLESEVYESPIKVSNQSGTHFVYAKLGNEMGYVPPSVDSGMILNAIVVNKAGEITKEMSQSYFIGMRTDSETINMPVLSITTDPDNLFDYFTGIYVAGRAGENATIQEDRGISGNYFLGLKKKARVEYFEVSRDKSFEMDAEISVKADVAATSTQKNLILDIGDSDYSKYAGSSMLDYISASGTFTIEQSPSDINTRIRNYLVTKLYTEGKSGMKDCMPCSVYIDGEYWGLYYMLSDFDGKYLQRHYGVSEDDVLIKTDGQVSARFKQVENFITQNDMSDSSNYAQVKAMIDVDSYAEYICLNMFVGTYPFSPGKGVAWRTVSDGGKGYADGRWRFLIDPVYDCINATKYNTSTIDSFLQLTMQSDLMLQSMLMNKEFCNTLVKTMEKLCDEVFVEERCDAELEKAVNYLKKAAIATYIRFCGSDSEDYYNWITSTLGQFLAERPEYILKYTVEIADKGGDLEKAIELLSEMEDESLNEEETEAEENLEEGEMEGADAGQGEAGEVTDNNG